MAYGFILIYFHDFAPGKAAWITDYAVGEDFEARLGPVHGNLFALVNVAIRFALARLPAAPVRASAISWLALAGMLMPLGILAEVIFGAPPALMLADGVAMLAATRAKG